MRPVSAFNSPRKLFTEVVHGSKCGVVWLDLSEAAEKGEEDHPTQRVAYPRRDERGSTAAPMEHRSGRRRLHLLLERRDQRHAGTPHARRVHIASHCTHNARTPHARRVHTACPPFALRRRCSPLLTAHRSPLTTQYEKPPEFETLLNEIATFEPSSLKPKESRKPFGLMHRHRSGRNTDRNTDREADRRSEHRGPASYFSSRNTDRATDRGNEDESRGEPREDHARGATVHAPCSQHACTVHAPCMHRATQRAYTVHTTQRAHARPGAGRGAGGLATQARQQPHLGQALLRANQARALLLQQAAYQVARSR